MFKRSRLLLLLVSAVIAPLAILRYLARTDPEQQKIKWATQIHRTSEKPSCRPRQTLKDYNMDQCFNYSKCPLSSNFMFYLYPLNDSKSDILNNSVKLPKNSPLISVNLIHRMLARNIYRVLDPTKACVFITVVESCGDESYPSRLPPTYLKNPKHSLLEIPNHVVWKHCPGSPNKKTLSLQVHGKKSVPIRNAPKKSVSKLVKAILISEHFEQNHFRRGFDIVVSSVRAINSTANETRENSMPLFPIRREYLATYVGTTTSPTVKDALLQLQNQEPSSFAFEFSTCNNASGIFKEMNNSCANNSNIEKLMRRSTFSIILMQHAHTITDGKLQLKLFLSLKQGAIPVVIGTWFVPPFSEVLDWSKIMLTLPLSRIPEIPYLLKSFTDLDIYEYRANGRKFFNKYFSSVPNVVDTLLATLRTRIGMVSLPFNTSKISEISSELSATMLKDVRESSEESNRTGIQNERKGFTSNFSSVTLEKYNFWNSYKLPFNSLPYNAWTPALPSEEKFMNFSSKSLPSTEVAFSRSLGGNYPSEQFTIVALTYNREKVLLEFLKRLKGAKFLHKVIVVWNSPHLPSPDLKWPDIGVEIHVIIMRKNSLNNRFIPYDAIETEAVLSLDDDVFLSNVELLFGFRIWRENRDQIVGFPTRYHLWNEKSRNWAYAVGSCEFSMVLEGAAFFHKMYSYLYTYEMPRAIREHVSAKMNCEDIALNFLVAHVTRKPPIKIMRKSNFGCRNCKSTLHGRGSHYKNRRNCLNLFAQIYGYMPLLHTQFRAEGLLPLKIFPQDVYNCSRPRDELENVHTATTVKYPVSRRREK